MLPVEIRGTPPMNPDAGGTRQSPAGAKGMESLYASSNPEKSLRIIRTVSSSPSPVMRPAAQSPVGWIVLVSTMSTTVF